MKVALGNNRDSLVTYRYIASGYHEDDFVMRLYYIHEPKWYEYVVSFFGLIHPWPDVCEREVIFINQTGSWFEYSLMIPAHEDLSDLLDRFRALVKNNPFNSYIIGRI